MQEQANKMNFQKKKTVLKYVSLWFMFLMFVFAV